MKHLLMLVLTWSVAAGAAAQDRSVESDAPAGRIELDETVISGNQELPKVLYILPWQRPEGLPEIELRAQFAEQEVFRRLYPPAYRRELEYYELLNSLNRKE